MNKRIKLKLFRIEKDLKQEQIAKILGITVSYYCYIEQNKRAGSEKVWNKLQEHFGLSEKEISEMKSNQI